MNEMDQATKAKVRSRKIRTLAIFVFACMFSFVASKTFKWFVATNHLDFPIFVWYIYLILVMAPTLWAYFNCLDAWNKKVESELFDDKNS